MTTTPNDAQSIDHDVAEKMAEAFIRGDEHHESLGVELKNRKNLHDAATLARAYLALRQSPPASPGWAKIDAHKQAIKNAEDRCYNEDHNGLDDDEIDDICFALMASLEDAGGRTAEWNWDVSTAPKDGTLLQLLIEHDEDGTEERACDGGFENEHPHTRTFGFNNGADDGEDIWKFPGWDWCQDEIVSQGCGKVVAWALMLPHPGDAIRTASAPPAGEGE